ncbi:conserved hypothetical protein [Burkholderia cenocepacia]|nr:conserved hypothetical protein [Burkholderia cenocepacia]
MPLNRYLSRHFFEPLERRSRYRPPPSKSLFPPASSNLALRHLASVRGLVFIVRRGYGIPPNPGSHTPNLTPKFWGCPGLSRDVLKQKTRVSPRLDAGFGTSGYYLKLVFGAGCRTRTRHLMITKHLKKYDYTRT